MKDLIRYYTYMLVYVYMYDSQKYVRNHKKFIPCHKSKPHRAGMITDTYQIQNIAMTGPEKTSLIYT